MPPRWYGQLAASTTASGNASVTIPDGFGGGDTLNIFVEEVNGNNLTDFASELVALTITSETAPTGLTGGGDKITGTDATMEYSADGGLTWAPCTAPETTGLTPGTYLVRTAATGSNIASDSVSITVGTFSPGGGGGGGCDTGVGAFGMLALIAASWVTRRKLGEK